MSRRRFFVPPELIQDGVAQLPPDQAHRARDVLRLRDDCEIEVFNGKGNSYTGRLVSSGHHLVVNDLKVVTSTELVPSRLVVAAAVIKAARFEWMLEKATELGTDEFIPLVTRYSDLHFTAANLRAKLDRWRRIVRQACEQCGRDAVPAVQDPVTFLELLNLQQFSAFARLICYESGGVPLSKEMPSGPVMLCVGPEGGWHAGEIDAAARAGYRLVSLGRKTLRAETAAIAAIALLRIAS